MRKLSLMLMALVAVFSSCHYIFGRHVRGDGNIKTDERAVASFKNLRVSASLNVYLSQGEIKPIRIEGDENLLPYIIVEQDGDDLVIRNREGFNLDGSQELKVYVTAPVFHTVSLSGAGDIIADNKITNPDELDLRLSGAGDIKMELDAPKVDANISGVGSLYLKGQAKDIDMNISGAGSAHCYDLLAENTRVGISGVGDAEVYASVKLDAHVSGAGSVDYKGNATDVTQEVSGVGSVNKRQ